MKRAAAMKVKTGIVVPSRVRIQRDAEKFADAAMTHPGFVVGGMEFKPGPLPAALNSPLLPSYTFLPINPCPNVPGPCGQCWFCLQASNANTLNDGHKVDV